MPTMDSHRLGVVSLASELASGFDMRILILGGTTEARELAALVAADARFDPLLSLAGRTTAPAAQPIATRVGGFGGVDGLAHFIRSERIQVVIDATHPFAAQISANAVAACVRAGVPLGSLIRPPWRPEPGDRWTNVPDAASAAEALGATPRRVFLTVGRLELAAFAAAPQHVYLVRAIDEPDGAVMPPNATLIRARGPFDVESETRLIQGEAIDVVVSKNSGGEHTYAKIAAARRLGLRVVMIERPQKPAGIPLADAAAALSWLETHLTAHDAPRSARGV